MNFFFRRLTSSAQRSFRELIGKEQQEELLCERAAVMEVTEGNAGSEEALREHGAGDVALGNANSNVDPDKEDMFRATSSPASQGRHGDTILDNI